VEAILPSTFRLARNVSKHSDYRFKIGAVIVKKGKPLAVGFNQNKTHPSVQYTIHAEVDALLTCEKEHATGSTVYIYREHLDGTPALARPCPNCFIALRRAGVSKVIYTIDYPPFYLTEMV
jgi:deoxycytidylate deaminase